MYQKLQKAKGNLCVQNQHSAKVNFCSTSHLPTVWVEYVSSNIQDIYNNVATRIYASFFLKCVVILEDIFNLFPFSKKVPKTNIV